MKKLFTFLLIATGISCFAQPTITSAISGTIGDEFSFTLVNTTDFDPGPAGENVTWDFSGISTIGTLSEYTYITPEATGEGGTFPGSNTATDFGVDTHVFYNITSSEFSLHGIYTPTTVIPYSDPEELIVFPLTYGTTNEDELYSEFFSGIETIRSGSNELLGDGYGTLILPSGTYTNVLRMKLLEDYSDEAVGFPITFEYDFESYYWFAAGVKGPLFQYNHQEIFSGGSTLSETYQINNNIGTIAINTTANDLNIRLFPNPATDRINISGGPSIDLTSVEITDITGKTVYNENLSGAESIVDVADLISGIYVIRVCTSKGIISQTITIQ